MDWNYISEIVYSELSLQDNCSEDDSNNVYET